jgi:hypothetical protein
MVFNASVYLLGLAYLPGILLITFGAATLLKKLFGARSRCIIGP